MADDSHARQLQRFFKTGPGEYGEGDKFVGLRNPQVRLVVKEAWKETPLSVTVKLIESPLHEVRLCGLLIMVEQYLKAKKSEDFPTMNQIFNIYISLHRNINNWDLVDLSAPKIVGNHEVLNPELTIMEEWIEPDGHTIWQQRISMISTWMLTRHGREDACFRRVTKLFDSPHNLLHKIGGWMLRETWKKGYKQELRNFLEENVSKMPSIMLSHACEQMSVFERQEWQQKRRDYKNFISTPVTNDYQ